MVILDIETVPEHYSVLIENKKYLADRGISQIDKLLAKYREICNIKNGIMPSHLVELRELHEEIIKEASLDPLLGRIASIGIIHREKRQRVGRTFFDYDSEENLLNGFWDYIREHNIECKTVTFNGLNFDLPFLFFRSMKYGIEIPWHDISLKKFTAFPHFDLMQHLSFWKSFRYKSLDYFAKFFGYECDPENDPNGSDVYKWWCSGQFSRIQDYNLEDCNRTAFIYNCVYKYYSQSPKPMAERKVK